MLTKIKQWLANYLFAWAFQLIAWADKLDNALDSNPLYTATYQISKIVLEDVNDGDKEVKG